MAASPLFAPALALMTPASTFSDRSSRVGDEVPTISSIKDPLELGKVERPLPIEIENSQPCPLAQKRVDIPRSRGVVRRCPSSMLEDNRRPVADNRLDRTFEHFPLRTFYVDLDHRWVVVPWEGIIEGLCAHGDLLDRWGGRVGQ